MPINHPRLKPTGAGIVLNTGTRVYEFASDTFPILLIFREENTNRDEKDKRINDLQSTSVKNFSIEITQLSNKIVATIHIIATDEEEFSHRGHKEYSKSIEGYQYALDDAAYILNWLEKLQFKVEEDDMFKIFIRKGFDFYY